MRHCTLICPARLPGRGAARQVEGSIFAETPLAFDRVLPDTELTVHRSIVPAADVDRGQGNLAVDPRLFGAEQQWGLRPGSPALGTGPNGLNMGARVPAGASISGEPAAVTAATVATLSVGGPGITDYRYRLDSGPWSDAAPVGTPVQLADLPDGMHSMSVIGLNTAGVWQDEAEATQSQTWTVERSLSRLVINEVMASNDQALEHAGTYPDAIELLNSGATAIDLSDMSLSDDPAIPRRFVFPAGTALGLGEYLVAYADDSFATSGIHLGFALNEDGEGLYLYDSPARGGQLVDSVQFGMQVPHLSIGRTRDGSWQLTVPTFGRANQQVPLGDASWLRINEWLAQTDIVLNNDFIEIYNPDPAPVALGGLYVTDRPRGWPGRHQIAPLSFVAGQGLAVLVADEDPQDGADHVDFRLARQLEMIGLLDPQLQLIDLVRYPPQTVDVSQGACPTALPRSAPSTCPIRGWTTRGRKSNWSRWSK